jgi:UDP-N-acetylglucosamine:LPS N-acetylglucosamine transferase
MGNTPKATDVSRDLACPKIALLAAPGGHLTELLALRRSFQDFSHFYVLQESARVELESGIKVYRVSHGLPGPRGLFGYLANLLELARIFRIERPTVILTTGSPSVIPAALLAAIMGIGFVYVETVAAVHKPTRSLRAIRPLVGRIFVQWPSLAHEMSEAEYRGSIFGFL